MSSFDKYVRRVFFGNLSLILVLAGIFLLAGHPPWARGFALGGAASLANLVIMAHEVRRAGEAENRIFRPSYANYALRMTIITAALIYSAVSVDIALWAAIPALFSGQLTMTCGEFLGGKEQRTT